MSYTKPLVASFLLNQFITSEHARKASQVHVHRFYTLASKRLPTASDSCHYLPFITIKLNSFCFYKRLMQLWKFFWEFGSFFGRLGARKLFRKFFWKSTSNIMTVARTTKLLTLLTTLLKLLNIESNFSKVPGHAIFQFFYLDLTLATPYFAKKKDIFRDSTKRKLTTLNGDIL